MNGRKDWYWSERIGGYRLRAFTLSPEVAKNSAGQWARIIGRPCQPIELEDRFAGNTAWSVLAPRLAGDETGYLVRDGEARAMPLHPKHTVDVYKEYFLTPDGETIVGVLPLLLGQASIVRGPSNALFYSEEWMYESLEKALNAFAVWHMFYSVMTHPVGWVRAKTEYGPTIRRSYTDDGMIEREWSDQP